MKHQVGELTERVKLLRRADVDDGAGGAGEALNEYAEVWAKIVAGAGGEKQRAERTDAIAGYLVVIHNRSDVLEADVIRWGGRDLNIRQVKAQGKRDLFLEIEAELGAAL